MLTFAAIPAVLVTRPARVRRGLHDRLIFIGSGKLGSDGWRTTVVTPRKELLALTRACGVDHPALVPASRIEILDSRFGARTVADLLGGRGRGLSTGD